MQSISWSLSYAEKNAQAVIVMSDQMPYYIKLRSGKQMYLASEVASSKRHLTSDEKTLTEKSGGGSQAGATFCRADDEGNAGRSVAVGESHQDQDKFRITVAVRSTSMAFR